MDVAIIGIGKGGTAVADEFVRYADARNAGFLAGGVAVETNTDTLSELRYIPESHRVLIGQERVKGHGVAADPQLGEEIATEEADSVVDVLDTGVGYNIDAVVVIAGLAGGSGGGCGPVIANYINKLYDVSVIGLGILPAEHEGSIYLENAAQTIDPFIEATDGIIAFDNDEWVEGNEFDTANERLVRSVAPLFEAVDTGPLAIDDVVDLLQTGEVSTVGHATREIEQDDTGLLSGVLGSGSSDSDGNDNDPGAKLGESVRKATLGRQTFPVGLPGATGTPTRALVVVSGPASALDESGIQRSQGWLESQLPSRSEVLTRTRETNEPCVEATVLLAGVRDRIQLADFETKAGGGSDREDVGDTAADEIEPPETEAATSEDVAVNDEGSVPEDGQELLEELSETPEKAAHYIEHIRTLLQSDEVTDRRLGAEILAETDAVVHLFEPPSAGPDRSEAPEKPDSAAIEGLLEDLRALVDDGDPTVRTSVANTYFRLTAYDPERVLATSGRLRKLLTDDDPEVREHTVWAICEADWKFDDVGPVQSETIHDIELSDVDRSLNQGTLTTWFVEAGDSVPEGRTIAEVEADGEPIEIPAPASGSVHERCVTEGTTMKADDVLARIAVESTVAMPTIERVLTDLSRDAESTRKRAVRELETLAAVAPKRVAESMSESAFRDLWGLRQTLPELLEPILVICSEIAATTGIDMYPPVGELRPLLDNNNPRVRAGAASVLGSIGIENAERIAPAADELSRLLEDEHPEVRLNAAEAYALLAEESSRSESLETAIGVLGPLLHVDDEDLRRRSAELLSYYAGRQPDIIESVLDEVVGGLDDHNDEVRMRLAEVMSAVAESDPGAAREYIDELESHLDDDDSTVRIEISFVFSRVAHTSPDVMTDAVERLRPRLADVKGDVRGNALLALRGVVEENPDELQSFVSDITPFVGDPNVQARENAVYLLGELAGELDEAAVDTVFEWLDDDSEDVQQAAVTAVSKIAKEHPEQVGEHIDRLRPFLEDDREAVRYAATNAMMYIAQNHPELVRPLADELRERLRTEGQSIRLLAAGALEGLVSETSEEVQDIEPFREMLGTEMEVAREIAARVLASVAEDEPERLEPAIDELGDALGDENEDVRRRVAKALAYMAPEYPEAMPIAELRTCLDDQHPAVRNQSMRTIGNVARQESTVAEQFVTDFRRLLDDDDETVRANAAIALLSVAKNDPALARDAIEDVDDHLSADQEATREKALRFLAEITEEYPGDVVPLVAAVRDLLNDESTTVRNLAVEVLASVAIEFPEEVGPATDGLRSCLDADNLSIRAHAAVTLTRIDADTGSLEPVIDTLTEALTDDSTSIPGEEIFEALTELAADAPDRVREAIDRDAPAYVNNVLGDETYTLYEFRGTEPDDLTPGRYYRGTVEDTADVGMFVALGDGVTGLLQGEELNQRVDGVDLDPGDAVIVWVRAVRDDEIDLGWSYRQSADRFTETRIDDPGPAGSTSPERATDGADAASSPRPSTDSDIDQREAGDTSTETAVKNRIPETIPSAPQLSLSSSDFEEDAPIGSGGNADVYRAEVPTDDGTAVVAIKNPRMNGTLHTDTVTRMIEEAEKWQSLDDHDHIVDIVDYGTKPLPWIAMEYMDGGDLGEHTGDMPFAQAVWTAIATTKAIRYSFSKRGVIHLDLKPENILLRSVDDGWDVPKVADWGLSKHLRDHSQSVEGLTPHYAAPEQFAPEEYGPPDNLTDVYQLGAVFYELFTGRPPFDGTQFEVMNKIRSETPTPPSEIADVPPAIDEIVLTAMSKEKSKRYEDALLLRNALQDLFDSL